MKFDNNELLIVEDGTREKIWAHYGKTRQDIDRDVGILKEWLKQQPHLPDDEDDYRLERMLIGNKCRVEKTKNQLENLYTFRSKHPEIMEYFDVDGETFNNLIKGSIIFPLPRMTKNLERVIYVKILDPVQFRVADMHSTFVYTEYLLKYDYNLSYIFLIDMANVSLEVVKGMNFNVTSLFFHGLLDAFSGKFTQTIFINAPSYFTIFLAVLKLILKPKLYERLQMNPAEDVIHEHIPRENLPRDFGGEEKSVDELWELMLKELHNKKEYLKMITAIRSDESRRTGPITGNELFGTEGTFKKLNLD